MRSDLSNISNSGTKASTALEFESRLRGSLENRTAQLETELTKAWEQIKDLTEKVSTAEATKRHLEIELDKVGTRPSASCPRPSLFTKACGSWGQVVKHTSVRLRRKMPL